MLLDGRQQEVHLDRDGDTFTMTIRGRTQQITVEDPRAWNPQSAARNNAGVARVASPMPGKVVRVLVQVGDTVDEGAGLAVVEAMKMQNELKSPLAGIVTQVHAVEGATVNANQVLVLVEVHAG